MNHNLIGETLRSGNRALDWHPMWSVKIQYSNFRGSTPNLRGLKFQLYFTFDRLPKSVLNGEIPDSCHQILIFCSEFHIFSDEIPIFRGELPIFRDQWRPAVSSRVPWTASAGPDKSRWAVQSPGHLADQAETRGSSPLEDWWILVPSGND